VSQVSKIIEQATEPIPLVDLSAQYDAIRAEVDAAIAAVLERSDFILGRDVGQFEEEFADYCETRHAIGDSGISALELTLRAFEIGPGDEVIIPANTFIATALAISATGATPKLVDVDAHTYLLDLDLVREAITSRTRAIMPVHLYGHPVDIDPLVQLAAEHELVVIEDACQAHGALYRGRRAGSLADAAAFSFYPGKNLGAYGDGGIVVTNRDDVADYVRLARDYGQRAKYEHVVRGYNRRLDTVQAAVLRVKLRYLDSWNEARSRHAALYTRLLEESGIVTPAEADWARSVWHLYVVRVDRRDALKDHLAVRGIAAGIHYPIPIHAQPAYESLGDEWGSFPVTEGVSAEILSLPMYAELTPALVERVVEAIVEFAQQPEFASAR
jgi:dTDP-3-amino-3,4,6-trideoxy-alpha-D-glucose transaminase